MKKSFVRGTWQVKRAFSPCVIAEGGGRTIYVAGHTGQVDDSGKSLAADFDAQFKQTFRNIEKTLAEGEWLAGPRYSIADIDAFAMLRSLPDLAPEVANARDTPRVLDFIARNEARPAVKAALATSRSGKPEQHFVPGVEPSRWG